MRNGSPRILIIRLSAIGDVVRVLPALSVLRSAFPKARIDWVVEAKAAAVVERHPALDEVLVFERPPAFGEAFKAFRALVRKVRANDYDMVLDFHGILKSGLLTAFSGADKRYGFAWPRAQEGSHLFTNKRLRLPSKHLNRVEENLQLCELVCPTPETHEALIHVPVEVQDAVDEFFDACFDGGKQVVAMHIPMDRAEKRWPLEHFAALSDMLLADGRFNVLLTWGPGQFEAADKVLSLSRRQPDIAPETADLKHYAWLIHRADLYFGGDTGPMHLAWAMGTPVVAFFGGTDPAKHAPYKHACEVLSPPAEVHNLAPEEQLRHITPEMAYDACVRMATRSGL